MKPIQKKKTAHSLPMGIKIALALAFLLASVLFYRALTAEKPAEPAATVLSGAEKEKILCRCSLDEILSVTISPRNGQAYTLVPSGGHLTLSGDPAYPIKAGLLNLIEQNVCNVRSERTISSFREGDLVSLAFFGLDEPRCSARILMRDGTVHRIRLGNQIRGDEIPYYYFLWDEDLFIYAGGTDMYSAFSAEFGSLHTVEEIGINTGLLDRFSVSGGNSLALEYTDTGWYCVSPCRYPLNGDKVSGYLKNVKNLQFSEYICEASESALESFGLEPPSMTVSFTEAESVLNIPDRDGIVHSYPIPERTGLIRLGKSRDEYTRYAEYNGSVYAMTCFLTDFLESVSAFDLVAASPFCVELYQLNSLTLTQNGTKTEYTIALREEVADNGDLVVDSEGNILYSLSVQKNGVPIENDAFLAWYNNVLRALVPSGQMNGALPGGAEAAAELTLAGGRDIRTVSFIPIDPIHYAMSVEGTALYYVSESLLASITNAP